MRHSLYKYYSDRKWAEAFLEGELLFRSLAYFRDYEDNNVREDQNEGTAIFRPVGGLVMNNETQGTTVALPGWRFESEAKQDEILVFCASMALDEVMRARFNASVCVEILNTAELCGRVESALPDGATFPGRPGRNRIGSRVEYYKETDSISPRWALPDLIARSKFDSYAWQKEYRLVFCLTNALGFEKSVQRIVQGNPQREASNPAEHHTFLVKSGSLRDICRLHEFEVRG